MAQRLRRRGRDSTLFAGGLSHRSATCPPDSSWDECHEGAESVHLYEVPEAVHGLRAYRLAFTGAPTSAGESDPGTMGTGGSFTSNSGAQSDWITDGLFSVGRESYPYGRLPPSAYWTFSTAGDDAFDVASFALDLQYLALPE